MSPTHVFFALDLVLAALRLPTATQTTTKAASFLLHVDALALTNVTRLSSFSFIVYGLLSDTLQ